MAQHVSVFCSKAKVQLPTVEFQQGESSQEPSCTCKVTLHAYFDAENDGFPEMTFQETARTKKASKGAAMAQVHEFLSGTTAFKKLMFAAQSPWTCLEKILLTTSIAIMADVRCHVVGAVIARDGWIPIAALMHNARMRKACKGLGESVVQKLDEFVRKLLSAPPPAGLQLSKDGYSVKVLFKDEDERHTRLNPGFVEGGHGSPEDALKVVCDLQGPNGQVQCVVVPADSSQLLVEKDLPSSKYHRQSLADALGAPVEAVVRVGKLQGPVRERSLEEVLLKHSDVSTEKAAAAQGGTPAKRARCDTKEAQDDENAPQNNAPHPAASADVSAEGGQCKRDACGEAVERPTFRVHSALKEQIRLADFYAAAASPDARLNVRASFLTGVPVYGDMLCTRVRLMASGPNEDAPLCNNLPVTVKPVMYVLWDSLGVQDLFQSSVQRWPCRANGIFSMVKRMPEQYDPETWSGKVPAGILEGLLALFPGHTCNVHKSEMSDNSKGKQDGSKGPKGFSHAINITLEGRKLTAQAESETSAAVAEQAAALGAIRRIEALMAQLLVCGDSTLPLQQATSCSRLEWESRGLGSKLPMNSNVKAEVCVAAVVQGNAVEVERCFIRGRLGAHSLIPAVEDALLQMKPGAAVRFQTELPFLGHDPTGKVPRCPVEIQVKAATKQPGTPGTPAIFTPTLASQRHALALQIVKEHGCQNVVDFGCGEGTWIKMLMFDPEQTKVTSVLGVDESPVALQRGSQLMSTVQLQCRQQEELKGKVLPAVKLCEGSVTQGPLLEREGWGEWQGCDAAVACEVVEHVHNPEAFAQTLLGSLRPGVAFVSTPNMEYNKVIRFCAASEEDPCKPIGSDGLAMRDRDHKFEWSRAEFQEWCLEQAQKYSYKVSFAGVGECTDHAQWLAKAPEGSTDVGMATQVAIFKRESEGEQAIATGTLAAHLVYEMKQQTEEELEACAKEYMQLRKQIFDETRSGAADASDGAESLLASLSECVLNEQDFFD